MNDHLFQRQRRRPRKYLVPAIALALVAGALLCSNAWARGPFHHNGGVRFGIAIGAPLAWYGAGSRWYGEPNYYPYYPYYPYYTYYRPLPTVYVEQGAAPTDVTPAAALWYFCRNPKGYYPYVKQCTTAWRTVTPPQPSAAP